jgi:hypothetical protein
MPNPQFETIQNNHQNVYSSPKNLVKDFFVSPRLFPKMNMRFTSNTSQPLDQWAIAEKF